MGSTLLNHIGVLIIMFLSTIVPIYLHEDTFKNKLKLLVLAVLGLFVFFEAIFWTIAIFFN
jgi:hypothetical protein